MSHPIFIGACTGAATANWSRAIVTSNTQITKSGTNVRESRLVMCRASPAWSSW